MNLENKLDKKYVITTAQLGATPNWNFLNNLELYCKENNSELIILPTNGKMATSRRKEDSNDEERLHNYFSENFKVIDDNYELNNHLAIRHFPVKAQQIDPITGWGRFIQYDKSGIFASPKQRMKCFANSNDKIPKILMSTGAITRPNYKDNNWGTKALLDHTYGAIVVEIKDEDEFHFRQLRANSKGAFVDLAKRYENNKVKKERTDALVLGDIHSFDLDLDVMRVTYDLIKELNPKNIILHDLFNGTSVSHHDKDNILRRAQIAEAGQDSLYNELKYCGQIIENIKLNTNKKTKIVVVKSNHDEFLEGYLKDGRFTKDPQNLKLASELVIDYLNGKDVIEEGIKKAYGKIKGVKYLRRGDNFKVRGWQLGNHGDKGGNGSKGSIKQSEATSGKTLEQHVHSPEILRYSIRGGTSSILDPDYAKGGPSGWMHTHIALNSTAQPQLINIINDRYKI